MDLVMPGLVGSGLAFGFALGLLVLAAWVGRDSALANWAMPLALGLGYVLGHAWIRGWIKAERPPFPPQDASDWIPWLALAAMLVGLFEVMAPTPAWARWENRLALVVLSLWLVLGPLFASVWGGRELEGAWHVGVIGLGMLSTWEIIEIQARRLGRGLLLPLTLVAGGTAAVLMLANSLVMAEFAAVLAAVLAAAWLVSLGKRQLSLARGGLPVLVVVAGCLLSTGHFYLYDPAVPGLAAVALALAPAMLWADRIGPARRLSPKLAGLLRTGAVLLPILIAVALTAWEGRDRVSYTM